MSFQNSYKQLAKCELTYSNCELKFSKLEYKNLEVNFYIIAFPRKTFRFTFGLSHFLFSYCLYLTFLVPTTSTSIRIKFKIANTSLIKLRV